MRIAFITDGSEESRAAGALLCRLPLPPTTRVTTLAIVAEQPPFSATDTGVDNGERVAWDEITRSRTAIAQTDADARAQQFRARGWEVDTLVRHGNVGLETLAALEELRAELVVTASLENSSSGRILLGALPKKVLLAGPCSLLVTRAARAPTHEGPLRILLAYDGSESARQAAAELASIPWSGRAEITVLTVLTVATTLFRRDVLQRLSRAWNEYRKRVEAELEEVAGQLRQSTSKVTARLLEGGADPSDEILQAVGLLDIDILVTGYGGKSMIKQALLGSVTSQAIEYAPCSVWVVRPKVSADNTGEPVQE